MRKLFLYALCLAAAGCGDGPKASGAARVTQVTSTGTMRLDSGTVVMLQGADCQAGPGVEMLKSLTENELVVVNYAAGSDVEPIPGQAEPSFVCPGSLRALRQVAKLALVEKDVIDAAAANLDGCLLTYNAIVARPGFCQQTGDGLLGAVQALEDAAEKGEPVQVDDIVPTPEPAPEPGQSPGPSA